MKLLFVDRYVKGTLQADWKEGWCLYYAGKDLGHDVTIAGLDCPIAETEIEKIAPGFDLIIVSENYPEAPSAEGKHWQWWDWSKIKTPKLFWAIDTHLVDYRPFIKSSRFDYVALNNERDVKTYGKKTVFRKTPFCFHLSLAIRKDRYEKNYTDLKIYDVSFIGSMISAKRKELTEKNCIHVMQAYGDEYIKAMQSSKICFNHSLSYDINNKIFEILGSGSFLLSNAPDANLFKMFDVQEFRNCIWSSEKDLAEKIKFYLKEDHLREESALSLRNFVLRNHTFHNRLESLISCINGNA